MSLYVFTGSIQFRRVLFFYNVTFALSQNKSFHEKILYNHNCVIKFHITVLNYITFKFICQYKKSQFVYKLQLAVFLCKNLAIIHWR